MKELKNFVTEICELNVENLNSREEIIEKVINEVKEGINMIYHLLTNEEKHKYYHLLDKYNLFDYLKSLSFKERLEMLNDVIENADEYYLSYFIIESEDDKFMKDFLILYADHLQDYYIARIIANMQDEEIKNTCTKEFIRTDFYKTELAKTFSEEIKEEYIYIVNSISNKVEIILSLKDKEKRKYYSSLSGFDDYRSTLIVGTNDPEFIKEKYLEADSLKLKLNIIRKVEDIELKKELMKLSSDLKASEFFLSNIEEQNIVLTELTGTPIDENITIGIELECCNKYINEYESLKNIFNTYTIKKDSSVKKGFEIVSPVISYNLTDMNKLKNVCELLKKNQFYTDKSCGGHIHIGASYLTRREDFLMLVYLYTNVEEILYYISDKENTAKRITVKEYASKTKSNYLKAVDEGMFNNDGLNGSIKDILENITKDRYKGMNLQNIGGVIKNTIEFRMPNGEIDYDELVLNIKLFARLIEISHKLNEPDISDELKLKSSLLSKTKNERKRLDILLDLLFTDEEEKEKYRRRYINNKKLDLIKINDILKDLKSNIFGLDNIVYDEDNKVLLKKCVK